MNNENVEVGNLFSFGQGDDKSFYQCIARDEKSMTFCPLWQENGEPIKDEFLDHEKWNPVIVSETLDLGESILVKIK